jgi:two-component system response regulator ChvI
MSRSNVKANAPAWAGSIGMPSPRPISEENKPIRLIFVDDDDDYREAAAAELVDLGFVVESFADGASMLAAVADGIAADVIVLDWSLPRMSGIDLLPRLRREGIPLPVFFLTGRSSPRNEILAFDRGALDFVDKSRGVPILAKRIRAIVKSSRRPPELEVDDTQHCGRLMLKPRVSRAFWDAIDVNLTLTEFNVVRLLASNVGNHLTYRALYDRMHSVGFVAGSGEEGYRTNVRSTIKRIRNKFRLVDPEFAEIENYASFGYCWGRSKDPAR